MKIEFDDSIDDPDLLIAVGKLLKKENSDPLTDDRPEVSRECSKCGEQSLTKQRNGIYICLPCKTKLGLKTHVEVK